MEKDFLEVFFGLEVEKELKALLEDAWSCEWQGC